MNYIGYTQNPPNISTSEGPAYVDANGNYFRIAGSAGSAPIGSNGAIDVQSLLNTITQPTVQMPGLDYTPPTSSDLQGKWNEFLDRASKDPDIVNYYKTLLDQAAGDTKLAISFLDRDYTTGVRQTSDTLSATLEKLGLTSATEQDTLKNDLNKRQIGLTDVGGGQTAYAVGGQPATELGQLNQTQKLRNEAEQRSAGQKIETMGLTKEKGVTSANQQLQQFGTQIAHDKGTQIENRAQSYMGLYNQGQQNDLLQAQINQNNQTNNPSPTLTSYNDRLTAWRAKGEQGDLPAGWFG
jgi:hypothetical protein